MYMMLVCACVCAGARAYAARPPDCGCTFNWYTQSGYYARVRIRQWERMGVVGGLVADRQTRLPITHVGFSSLCRRVLGEELCRLLFCQRPRVLFDALCLYIS